MKSRILAAPPRFLGRAAACSCLLALAGCDAGSGGGNDSLEGDLAGPDVMISALTEQVYTVGTSLSGEDWEMFSRVPSIFFGEDGNLFVFDAGAQRIVVVDQEGGLVRVIGRQGEGPGEFDGASAAALMPDGRLAVFEFGMPGLFEIVDAEGTFLETATVDIAKAIPNERLLPLPDGRLISAGGGRVRMAGSEDEEDAQAEAAPDGWRPIDLFSLDGAAPHVFYHAWGPPPAEVEDIPVQIEEGMTMNFAALRAFETALHYDVLADGRIAVVDSADYRVKFVTTEGVVDGQLERPIQPLPVTESMKDAFREDRLAALEGRASISFGPMGEAAMHPALRQALEEQIADARFADVVPVIAGMAVDREGRIWIARTGPDGLSDGPTDIVTPDGGYVGTLAADGLRTPTAFGPGGLMACLEEDDLGVQTVRVVRLLALEG